MSYRLMLILNAAIAIAAGAILVVAPKILLSFVGLFDAMTDSHLLLTRFYGGALVTLGVLLWFLKDSKKETVKTESFTMMIASIVGAAIVIVELAKGTLFRSGSSSWVLLLVYLAFAAGYAYLVFGVTVKVKAQKKPDTKGGKKGKKTETASAESAPAPSNDSTSSTEPK
jgi:hypothetical protein